MFSFSCVLTFPRILTSTSSQGSFSKRLVVLFTRISLGIVCSLETAFPQLEEGLEFDFRPHCKSRLLHGDVLFLKNLLSVAYYLNHYKIRSRIHASLPVESDITI